MEKNANKPAKKWVALVTYAIALLCLLAGLLIPLGNVSGFKLENMLFWQLPAAVKDLTGFDLKFGAANFTYGYKIPLFGLDVLNFNYSAIFALLYLVVAVAGLVGLIPVIASKKTSATALKTASVIEVLGAIVTGAMLLLQLANVTLNGYGEANAVLPEVWSYALIIAFGGSVLMLLVQSVAYKGGSGVIKFILFLLSAAAVFLAVYNVIGGWMGIGGMVEKLPAAVGLNGYYLLNDGTASFFGVTLLNALFNGTLAATYITPAATLMKILLIVVLALSLLVVINAVLDLMGTGKKTNKFMLIANVARYGLELVLVIVFVIFTFVVKEVSIGLFGWLLTVIALIQFIINIIRLVAFKPAKKTRKSAKPAVVENEPAENGVENETESEEEAVDKKATKRAAKEAKKAEKEAKKAEKAARAAEEAQAEEAAAPVPNDGSVYKVEPLYNGPVDDFIKKLSNSERIEFANLFLEHSVILPNVPDYVVGGNNNKFFSSVFIYYARIRDRVSDGLLNKLYEQGNIM